MWRYLKSVAIAHASDGTATRLCTDHLLEYLVARPWRKTPWLRPQDLRRQAGATGFQQVNLPLSNMDRAGNIITSEGYLKKLGILDLVDRDKQGLREAIETGDCSRLVYLAAEQLEVSAATFAYTYLYWLSVVKYTPTAAAKPVEIVENAGTPFQREPVAAAAAPAGRRPRP